MKKNQSLEGYFSGTSGLQLPFPKYKFPIAHESSSRLKFYSTLFSSIEINSSFYKLPLPRTISKWSGEVPDHFRFTFKLWKEITHVKSLNFKEKDFLQFMKVVSQVGHKKGCLLIQFPPSLKSVHANQLFRLLRLMSDIDPHEVWPVAVEFRDASWYNTDIFEEIESYKATVVIHDKKGLATPPMNSSTDFVYLRFHGPSGDYRGSYPDDFLAEYADYIRIWLDENKKVFVYFNNTVGEAINNLNTINSYVSMPCSSSFGRP